MISTFQLISDTSIDDDYQGRGREVKGDRGSVSLLHLSLLAPILFRVIWHFMTCRYCLGPKGLRIFPFSDVMEMTSSSPLVYSKWAQMRWWWPYQPWTLVGLCVILMSLACFLVDLIQVSYHQDTQTSHYLSQSSWNWKSLSQIAETSLAETVESITRAIYFVSSDESFTG